MSEASWKNEFYPIDADLVDEEDAIKHSLVKWRGLRKENLLKHGLEWVPIEVSGATCALCKAYWLAGCKKCPLYQFLGSRCDDGSKAPFVMYSERYTPEPMIEALEVIEFVERTCK